MPEYPQHWEADGLLRDGRPIHLRPIRPDDADALRGFHESLSEETIYFRFFAPYPKLSDRDVRRFTELDYRDRVAIVALLGGELIGIGRYDRRFVADVLPANRRMAATFAEAGFTVTSQLEDGVVHVEFDIEPTDESRAVMESRERRSEAMSVRRLLTPTSVAVVGASRAPGTVGHELLANVVNGGFTGTLHAVHPEADSILGVPCVRRLTEIEGDVDVAVIAVNSAAVSQIVADAAAKGVLGLIIVSAGFADADAEGVERQRELVRQARRAGMRIVGPNALGVMNTDPLVSLNASLAAPLPARGRLGFFCQSGALGSSILSRISQRGLGLSTFVSAGNRADVSGNDVLQFWEEDAATTGVLLYLETIGNPRKFARLTRRLSLRKPIVLVRTSGSARTQPSGHMVRRSELSRTALDALLAQSGIMQTSTLEELLQVAGMLAYQPIPHGNRLAVLSNSDALAVLAVNAAERAGLQLGEPQVLARSVTRAAFEEQLRAVVNDDAVDAVLVLYVPPVESDVDEEVREGLAAVSYTSTKPIAAVLVANDGDRHLIRRRDHHDLPAHGSVPLFADVEDAISTIAIVTGYAQWLAQPRGDWLTYDDIDLDAAEAFVASKLEGADDDVVSLSRDDAATLLGYAGIRVLAQRRVLDESDAVDAGHQLGWPVVVKTTDTRYLGRPELGGVRLSVENEPELRTAYLAMHGALDATAASQLVVQPMATPGVTCTISAIDDPMIGPVVSFSIGGTVSELLDDRAHRLAPMTDVDVAGMVREIRTSPLLFGYRGTELVDVDALESLLGRLGVLIDAITEVDRVVLNPVIVAVDGVAVVEARVTLRARPADPQARRLPSL